ncbi:MAG: hypothetical protein ACP5JH_05700 [Bacteroidota bacterium]
MIPRIAFSNFFYLQNLIRSLVVHSMKVAMEQSDVGDSFLVFVDRRNLTFT